MVNADRWRVALSKSDPVETNRGQLICDELKVNNVKFVCWLPDSETHFMHRPMMADPDIRVIQVCAEGESIAIIGGLHAGGVRGTILVEYQGFFDSGNVLKWAIGLQLPLVMIIGYLFYNEHGTHGWLEPFLKAFDVPYYIIDSDDRVGLISEAYAHAERRRNVVAVLVSSADNYTPGTAEDALRLPELQPGAGAAR